MANEEQKLVYHYNPETFVYAATTPALKSPLEDGVYLLPANATFKQVIAPLENHDIVFNVAEDKWEYQFREPEPQPDLVEPAKARRNGLLMFSDWTQLPDSPLTEQQKTAWRTYRQALRDVPQQQGFPQEINWPVPPASN